MGANWELLVLVVVVALVVGGMLAMLTGALDMGDPAVPVDAADDGLPDGPLQATDLPKLRFGLALRGYRMSEVDAFVDRVAADLRLRDGELPDDAELSGPAEPVEAGSTADPE